MKTMYLPISLLALTVLVVLMLSFPGRNKGETYSPAVGEIRPIGKMNEERAVHASIFLPNGKVLITGGFGKGEVFKNTAELFDPATSRFEYAGKMHEKRAGHRTVLLNNGQVLVIGGTVGNTSSLSKHAELFDPATNEFSLSGAMHIPRMSCSATLLQDGNVLVAGGFNGYDPVSSIEIYDPKTGTFKDGGNMKEIKGSHIAILMQNGNVLMTGSDMITEMYDPLTGTTTVLNDSPVGKVKHKYSATLLNNGKVLFTGGSDERDWKGKYADAMIYDPGKNIFSPIRAMHSSRFKHQGAALSLTNGNVLIAGGAGFAEVYIPTASAFFKVPGDFGKTLHYSTATSLKDGQVFITGGYDTNIASAGGAWIYKPGQP